MKANQSQRSQRILQRFSAVLALSSLLLGTSLNADDTEIFVGKGSTVTGVQPNVLFILDNSGSMSGASFDADGKRTGTSRMESMKSAFEEVMKTTEGINAGIMRFNGSGGSILYPVVDIDADISKVEAALDSNIGLTANSDDAVELKASGNVYLEDDTLLLAHGPNREIGTSITAFLQHEDDDGEQGSDGSIYYSGHYQFNMGNNQLNGLRYYDLGIPQGSQIISAKLEFTASRWDDSHIHLRIWGEDTDNPAQFGTNDDHITDRLGKKTTKFVDWEMTGLDTWLNGSRYDSPDITAVVQEIVDRPDWDPNDAMVLLIEQVAGTGHRAGTLRREDVGSSQGLYGSGTLLHITYHSGAPAETSQTVGLRFDGIAVPSGAIITNARIDFVSAQTNALPDGLNIKVQVENTGDAQTFEAKKHNLSSRTKFADVVTWHPDDAWEFNQVVTGPDVTSLVQRVVNDAPSWCGNNAMAFFLEPSTISDTLSRLAYAYDAGVGKKPTLTVSYTGGEGGCIEQEWSTRINADENDAEQDADGSKETDNNDDEIKIDDDKIVGLRFEDIPVAKGKKILEAYLELTASDNDGGDTTITVEVEDHGNPPAFPQSKKNISNRAFFSTSVSWPVTQDWKYNGIYRSPDLSAALNEAVNHSDWTAGNAVVLKLTGSSSADRDFWARDGSTGKAAKLILKTETAAIPTASNTVRWHEIELVKDLDPRGLTPATGALYEAALYYTGGAVDYGRSRNNSRYGRVSHPVSLNGGAVVRDPSCSDDDLDNSKCASEHISGAPVYKSPITSACQSSHVVLLTDGAANQNQATTKIGSLIGDASCNNDASIGGEKCARSLARWMANSDLMPSLAGSTNSVNTHTIAFNLSSPVAVNFLSDLAKEGNGGFYSANSAQELTTAFDAILQSVRSTAATFVAPGATVNQFNRLSHRAEVYFSVFKPDSAPRWAGNLKRYKLLGNPAVISDANDKAAVDTITGFFRESARSVWSEEADGAIVESGGAANQRPLNPDDLNVYTFLGSSKNLTNSSNRVHETNGSITNAILGVGDNAKRNEVLQWVRGVDVLDSDSDTQTSDVRRQYEDPLHSVPRIITSGGTDANPDTTIFFGTNGGYLHAVDGDTGEELFSFVPESQLDDMETRFDGTALFSHPYGVDGSPASWVYDANGNNRIEKGSDFAYLYFGLRRGGNEYFALDVTDRKEPKVLWHIKGGSGDFVELGQTWSTPVLAKIKNADGIHDVLVFGGGFNEKYDDPSYTGATPNGGALYIVDAKTGERLWYASSGAISSKGHRLSDMKHPIPGDISVIDINGDGLAEQIYAADLAGQIFRFDISSTAETPETWINGGVIADLGSTGGAPNNRRFFNAPDISLTSIAGKQQVAIAIGSGDRPNPLSRSTQDRFYVILQDSVFRAPSTYTAVTHSDLVDQSSGISDLTTTDLGWYFDLPNSGEKVLSSSITVAGKVIMTTYAPDSSASSCNPVIGTGRGYVFTVVNGSAFADLDGDDTVEEVDDRSIKLASGNIPPSPKVLFPEDGAPTVLIGPEQPLQNVDLGLIDEWTQIYRRPEDPE